MFQRIDCIQLYVSDLEQALEFYCDRLGHQLVWRSKVDAGLRMAKAECEIVLQTRRPGLEVDFLVADAEEAAEAFARAGGKIKVPPFDIQIGRCAVVTDPWGNDLILLDMRNGRLVTDNQRNITGVKPEQEG
jgi:lactoylglutathione lyase